MYKIFSINDYILPDKQADLTYFNKKNVLTNWLYGATLFIIFFSALYLKNYDNKELKNTWAYLLLVLLIPFGQIWLNYYWLAPRYLSNYKTKKYLLYSFFTMLPFWLIDGIFNTFLYPKLFLVSSSDSLFLYFNFITTLGNNILYCIFGIAASYIKMGNFHKKKLQQAAFDKLQAELKWLKTQISPHFLFNNLNNISALIAINPAQAQEAVANLGHLLRYLIYETKEATVHIKDEIAFLERFIKLNMLRYEKEINYSLVFDIDEPEVPIRPMILINFVENIFKHGAPNPQSKELFSGRIQLKDGVLNIDFENYIASKSSKINPGGIGLQNSLTSLNLNYDGRYQINQETKNNIFKFHLNIHLR